MKNNNKLDMSSYSIQKQWVEEVAPNFFNVDDISMLKAGLFGYLNDIMSSAFEDSIHMQTIMSKEVFPNKAVLPDSIYAYSALADYTDFYAVAATVPIVVAIKKSDILNHATLNPTTNYKELYISKFSSLIIDGKVPFIFDYDIKLICRLNKNDWILSAQYIMNHQNELSDIKTPFITSVVLSNGEEEYLYLNLHARQLERKTENFLIYSNDISENINFEAEYEGRLAGFNVYYRPNSYNGDFELLPKYFANSALPDSSTEFCLYSLSSTNKISISFSSHPSYFRPKFNSELMIEIFTTLGEDGNFTYSGEANNLTLQSIDEGKDINEITAFANVKSDSTGGKNEPSLNTIKQKVIQEFSTRKNIITELDLQRYFDDKSENSYIYFCKKRDDIIKRMYTAFLLLRNDSGEVIPTNTVDIKVYQKQFDNYVKGSNVLTLKAGTIFEGAEGSTVFNKVDGKYDWMTLVQRDSNLTTMYPGSTVDKRTNYLYGTPFLIKVNTNPVFMSYYLNSIYDTLTLSYSYMNENSYEEFIMSNVDIERNAIKQDYYTLTTYINTTVDMSNMFKTQMRNGKQIITGYKDDSQTHIRLYAAIEENGHKTGYIQFEPVELDDNRVYFQAKLETDDYINTNDQLNITNSIYSLTNLTTENLRANFTLSNDSVRLHMVVFYDGYDVKNRGDYTKLIPALENYTLCNVYQTDNNLQLFKNLNSIMNSTASLRIVDNEKNKGYYYKMKKVPMIRYMYMENDDNMKEIVSQLSHFKDILTDALPVMENNYSLDTKFYNTYGESKYFTIGRQKNNLNMVSISLSLNIKLSVEVTSDLVTELKSYIAKFIENTNNTETSFLYISNLIRNLEQEFSEITYIEFVGFNDYNSSEQIIENNFKDMSSFTKQQVIDFVPEYLNINRHIALATGELVFEPRIFLNFI